jgi:hypothetical protein
MKTPRRIDWHVDGHRGDAKIIAEGLNSYGDGPERYVGYIEMGPEDLALALAAPDLLAALRRMHAASVAGAVLGYIEHEKWTGELFASHGQAHAAIAKATLQKEAA